MINNIINTLSMVPGISGFSNKDTSINEEVQLENANKSIEYEIRGKLISLKIFIIISIEINALLIIKEIYSSIKHMLKQNNYKLKNMNVFIKGVK